MREQELGTIEQLIVTPIKPMELVLGKLIPYVVIAFIEVGLTLAVTALWFGIAIAGSIAPVKHFLLFLIGALRIGLLISTVAQNQLQAVQMTFAFLLPSILFIRFHISPEAMHQPRCRALGYAIPLTYFLQVLRGII